MSVCAKCGQLLTGDDIGAYRKFHDRFAVSFLCIPCFAKDMKMDESKLRERVEFLKRNGCAFFPAPKDPPGAM